MWTEEDVERKTPKYDKWKKLSHQSRIVVSAHLLARRPVLANRRTTITTTITPTLLHSNYHPNNHHRRPT